MRERESRGSRNVRENYAFDFRRSTEYRLDLREDVPIGNPPELSLGNGEVRPTFVRKPRSIEPKPEQTNGSRQWNAQKLWTPLRTFATHFRY